MPSSDQTKSVTSGADPKVEIFIAYASEDRELCKGLEKQLRVLQRDGLALMWSEWSVEPGADWQETVSEKLKSAQLILLLLSADFFESKYWLDIDMEQAFLRHRKKTALVLPVLLRPCTLPREFNNIEKIPQGKAVTTWPDVNEAFAAVAERIRDAIRQYRRLGRFSIAPFESSEVTSLKLVLRENIDSLVELLIGRERLKREQDSTGVAEITMLIDDLAGRIRRLARFDSGDIVAGARLIQLIGTGAFATVWSADMGGRIVAVKIFHLLKLTEGAMLWRFRRGMRAIQYLTVRADPDPAIVPILQVDDTGLAFSMPYIQRGNLEDIAVRKWTLAKKLDILLKLSRTIDFAHGQGVLHRDIKPANILIDDNEDPHLTDFDTADVAHMGTETAIVGGMGTPAFAAPEQLRSSHAANVQSDVYSLGRLLHYMLAEAPIGIRSQEHLRFTELRSFPRALVAVVRTATEVDPKDRYPTIQAFRASLEGWATRSSGLVASLRGVLRYFRRNRSEAVLAAALIGLLAASVYREGSRRKSQEQASEDLRKSYPEYDDAWCRFLGPVERPEQEELEKKTRNNDARITKSWSDLKENKPLLFSKDPPLPADPTEVALRQQAGNAPPTLTPAGWNAANLSLADVTFFPRGEAIGQMGMAVENARTCWEKVGPYNGTVSVLITFSNDGRVTNVATGEPPLPLGAQACVQQQFRNIQMKPFTYPPNSVVVTKRFRVVAKGQGAKE